MATGHLARLARRPLVVLAVLVLAIGATSAAWAFWSARGNAAGFATTGTLNAPTAVTASSTAGSGSVSVSWTAPTGTPAPTGYYVTRTTGGSAAPACGTSAAAPTTSTSCTDASVANGTYTYVVTAIFRSWTAASAASAAVTVSKADTDTTVTSDVKPSKVGQVVTYTATVTVRSPGVGTPNGTVAFREGGADVGCDSATYTLSGSPRVATCVKTYAAKGSHDITAVYGGSSTFNGSTSEIWVQTVETYTSSTQLQTSAPTVVANGSVTLTATVSGTPAAGTPTGLVTFKAGASILCGGSTALVGGSATCTTSFATPGTRTLTAEYAGSSSYGSSTSPTVSQKVRPTVPTGLKISNDTGTSGSDNITNVAPQNFSGAAQSGTTVALLREGVQVASTTASGGSFSIAYNLGSEGSASYAVTATDSDGNASDVSSSINVTLDQSVAAPALTALGSDTGSSSTDRITRTAANSIGGTAEAGATVSLFIGGTQIGSSVTANTSGAFTFTGLTLNAGSTTYTARQTDVAGNGPSALSAGFSVTLDTTTPTAPTLTGIGSDSGSSSTDRITNVAANSVSGTAEAGATVTLFIGSTQVGSSVTANASGAFTFTGVTLPSGTTSYTATQTDVAGNGPSVASTSLSVTLDTTAPNAPTVTDPKPGVTYKSNSGAGGWGATCAGTPGACGGTEASSTVSYELKDTSSNQCWSGSGTSFAACPTTTPLTVNPSGTAWTKAIALNVVAGRSLRLSVFSTDVAGNVSTTTTVTFSVNP